jgi:haloalkane dehalogenase
VDEGAGEPIFCVHGNPTWSFFYRKLILGLRGEYRVIAHDHIGCGFSDKPGDDRYEYTLASRIDDFEGLIETLSPEGPITLIVHDWGGAIGIGYAVRHPERIARLIVLNSGAFLKPAGKNMPAALRLIRDCAPAGWLVRGANAFAGVAARVCTVNPLPADVRRAYLAPYDSWRNRIATLRFVQDIPLRAADRAYPVLESIDQGLGALNHVPMLIAWGCRDWVFDRFFREEWMRRFPGAGGHRFMTAGHDVLEDAGGDILQFSREFLSAHPAEVVRA